MELRGFLRPPERQIHLTDDLPSRGLKIETSHSRKQSGGLVEVPQRFGYLITLREDPSQFQVGQPFEKLSIGRLREGQRPFHRLLG